VDSFKDMSQRTGIAVETLSRWSYAAKLSGTSIEKIQFGLKNFSQNLTKTNQKTTDLNTNFGKLGIETRDAAGNIRPMDDVLLDVADRFKTMPDGAQKAALAVQLFGKAGMDMIPMLNEGREGIERMNREADLFRVTIGQDAADAGSRLADNIDRLRAFTTGLVNTFGAQMFPALNTLLEGFFGNEEAVKMFQIAAVKMAALVGKSMITLIPIMMSVGTGILDIAGATMETLSTITGGAKKIFDFMASISSDDKAAFYKRQSAWLGEMQSGLDAGTDKIAGWKYGLERAAKTAEDVLAPAIYEISQSEQKVISDIKSGKKLIAAKTGPQGKGLGDDAEDKKAEAERKKLENERKQYLKDITDFNAESKALNYDQYQQIESQRQQHITKLDELNKTGLMSQADYAANMAAIDLYYNNQKAAAYEQERQLTEERNQEALQNSLRYQTIMLTTNQIGGALANSFQQTLQRMLKGELKTGKAFLKAMQKNLGQTLVNEGLSGMIKGGLAMAEGAVMTALGNPQGAAVVSTGGAEMIVGAGAMAAGAAMGGLNQGGGKEKSGGGGYSGGGGGYGGSGAGRSGRAENALRGAHGSAVINIDLGPLANDDNVVTGLGKFTEKIVVQAVNQGNKGRVKVNYV